MKKIFILVLLCFSTSLFAHTKLYDVGASLFIPFGGVDEDEDFFGVLKDNDNQSSSSYKQESEPSILDNASAFTFYAGFSNFYDNDDLDKKIIPLFDMKAGFIVGSIYGFGFYTQFMGGVSFRPSIMTIFNLSAGAKLTGAFTDFEYVVWPDIFGVDGVVDASFTLNFLYLIGLKGGVTFSFGSSGYGAMPYISIVTAFKDFGLRMNNY